MANIQSSKKDIRQIKKRRERNLPRRSRLRNLKKQLLLLISEKKIKEAETLFLTYCSYLDRAGRNHLIPQRRADRYKSRVSKLLNKTRQKDAA